MCSPSRKKAGKNGRESLLMSLITFGKKNSMSLDGLPAESTLQQRTLLMPSLVVHEYQASRQDVARPDC
jgi:hypothetical protein